jgi:hypothetical protein
VVVSTYVVGDTIAQHTRRGSHSYNVALIAPHTTAAGARTTLLTWAGNCCRCGATFLQTSGRSPPRYLIRTCELHRRRP